MWVSLALLNITLPTQLKLWFLKSQMPNTNFCTFPNLHLLKCKYTSICTSPVQMALGFQASGANLTWSRMLPRNPLNMWDSNPLSEPPQTCAAKPPQKPEVEPPQKKPSASQKIAPGGIFQPGGSFLARLMPWAALGIRNSILRIRNSILGMASHDLSNTKTTILGATPGAILGIGGHPHE